MLELDVNRSADFEALRAEPDPRWGGVDAALHAVAFAPDDALGGDSMGTPPEPAEQAARTSAYSFKAMAEALAPLMGEHGSLVGMDFDASVAWPVYDWMGVSKAALEAVCRYLARTSGRPACGSTRLRGPLETLRAASRASDRLSAGWRAQALLGWNLADLAPVADAVCFLLSDWSRGISGEIVHVDGGFHAMGAPPDRPAPAEQAAPPKRGR